jgi:hypothetical protein
MVLSDPNLIPFVMVPERNRPSLHPEMLPAHFSDLQIINPQELENAEFVSLVQNLDDISFGPMGLHMPGWVFYDCGIMPGMVFGLARPAQSVKPWVRRVMGVADDYEGLVPLTLFIAIAMLPENAWLVYTLTGINEVAPGSTSGRMVRDTLAGGVSLLNAKTLYATMQWRSRSLPHYTALSPLELLTAWTPAHDIPSTLTFRITVGESSAPTLLRSSDEISPTAPVPNRVINVDEPEVLQELQSVIESGAKVSVIAPPQSLGRYNLGLLRVEH